MKKPTIVLSYNKIKDFQNFFINQKSILLSPKDSNLVEKKSADEVDFAQNLIINEMVEKLSMREKDIFCKLNNALQRIEEGSFGLCEECEEPIAEKRLQAIPYCTACISCAEQQEIQAKQYMR